MGPLTIIGAGALAVWLLSKNAPKKSGPPKIVWEGTAWADPTEKWWGAAEPKLGALLINDPSNVDPRHLAWAILQGDVPQSVGGLPDEPYAPDGTPWQTDVPGAENFWTGAPTVIYLIDHVAEAVNAALPHWTETGEVILTQEG